jgi:hypothetical protein
MRGPRPFTQTDIASVFNAAKAAGFNSARVEILLSNGHRMIAIVGTRGTAEGDEALTKNPWNKVTP